MENSARTCSTRRWPTLSAAAWTARRSPTRSPSTPRSISWSRSKTGARAARRALRVLGRPLVARPRQERPRRGGPARGGAARLLARRRQDGRRPHVRRRPCRRRGARPPHLRHARQGHRRARPLPGAQPAGRRASRAGRPRRAPLHAHRRALRRAASATILGLLPNLARLQASIGEPRFDDALEEAATALADEGAALVSDLDRVTLDLGVDGASCLTASAALQLRGKKSWLAGTIAERGDASGPPPAIFWRAPRRQRLSLVRSRRRPRALRRIFRTLRGLLEGKLAKEKIGSEADRKALGGAHHPSARQGHQRRRRERALAARRPARSGGRRRGRHRAADRRRDHAATWAGTCSASTRGPRR